MLLYDSAISGNCYKVRLLLTKLGIGFERQELSVFDRSDRPDVLGGLNPALRVPTLVLDDGRSLGESNAILWYFGDGTELVPADPYERAQVMQWQFFEQYDHEPNIAVARFWALADITPSDPDREGKRKGGERARRFGELAADARTHVLFESPRRVAATLAELRDSHGEDRAAVLCRELTKTHEEIVRGSLAELADWAADREASGGVRGEITLVVAGVGQAAVRAAARAAAREARRAERHRGG